MRQLKIFVLLLLSASPLLADGGSIYSRFGLGDLHSPFSSRRFALGELGIALSDKDYLSFINPASLNELQYTRFETGLLYTGNNSQNSASSVFHTNLHFNGLMSGFPINRDYGISFAIGLVPYSDVAYDVLQTQSNALTDDYTVKYSGEGGISKFVLGTSYRLPLDFAIGVTYDYYFGRIGNNSSVTFVSGSKLQNASYSRETSYHGIGISAGLISGNLSKVLGITDLKDFKIGFTFSPDVTLSADSVDNSTSTIGTFALSTGSSKTKVPYKWGVGASFNFIDKYTFVLDYLYQPFSQYTNNGFKSSNLQDYYKMSLGFEFRDIENRSDSYWDHVTLRTGISYEQSQYKINGYGINQFSIYGGVGLPISYGTTYDSTLDLSIQYGRRGTTDNNLISENIFKFNVSFSLGEFWFLRTDR
ncbi:MAG: hypothetical protein NTX65_02020 [Ignavibacteriales bacterium]|nr:hypothetical protein [Ignavibacteriales bacterium]